MNRKKLGVLVVGLTLTALAGTAFAIYPPNGKEYDYVYYALDETTVVGGRRVGCGLDQSWGTRTPDYTITVVNCR